ncbi:MAG: beta-galactosidase [Candidatus Sumerlaeota bacterium]|nr:beta-galactosidase [Candidatus Sumerlaeota bacterium]
MRSLIGFGAFGVLALAPLLCAAEAAAAAPDPDRGLYAIWFSNWPEALQLPFIKGGQVVVQWAEVETGQGQYDFAKLDEGLEFYHDAKRKATVQVNGNNKPAWLFEKVAVLPHAASTQVRDKQGTLQYWDPIFENAYHDFVLAYGKHLRESPYRDAVLGVRLNFNAVGTEHNAIDPKDRPLDQWKPAPDGHIFHQPFSPEVFEPYRKMVMEAFIQAFAPDIRVFARNNIVGKEGITPEILEMFETGKMGLFHTSSEFQPRAAGTQKQYEAFLTYCRTGKTLGYAESWADSWGRHGGKTDPRTVSPCQWNYWRLLVDLNCGISFIGIYSADLRPSVKDPEFRAGFEFAAKYAGYHASPEQSPGAWAALREGDFLKGDYTFLMSRVAEKSVDTALKNTGPDDQRFGAWARAIEGDGRMVFRLDPAFAASLDGKPSKIRVVYLDEGTNPFTVAWDENGAPQTREVKKTGSGRWKDELIAIAASGLGGKLDGGDVRLTGQGRNVFHMVEVERGG